MQIAIIEKREGSVESNVLTGPRFSTGTDRKLWTSTFWLPMESITWPRMCWRWPERAKRAFG